MTTSPIVLKEAGYAGWKNALWIEQGPLALVLVPQVGGRLMGLRWQNRALYWVNEQLAGRPLEIHSIENPSVDKITWGFLLWGGDKTWLSPQERWNAGLPFLDLDSGAYTLNVLEQSPHQATIQMTSPICRETGIRITRTIQMGIADQSWTVTHRIENRGDRPIDWGAWGNSMVRRPATVFLPTRSNSTFPAGVKTFEAEGDAVAARAQVVSRLEDIAVVRCDEPIQFKYGVDSEQGAILAVMPLDGVGYLAYVKQFLTFHPEPYGHGCVAEVFNASEYPYLELEIHGPVRTLAPGASFELAETNRILALTANPETAADVKALMCTNAI